MASILIITPVEELQSEVINTIKKYNGHPGIYVSLNKTQKSVEDNLKSKSIDTSKLFFIDCVTSEKTREDVLHIHPDQLDMLIEALKSFIKGIDGNKFLIIDALSTLLIYNDENKVAQFVNSLTEITSKSNVDTVALSPDTKGEDLLNKIFNFFDEVKKR